MMRGRELVRSCWQGAGKKRAGSGSSRREGRPSESTPKATPLAAAPLAAAAAPTFRALISPTGRSSRLARGRPSLQGAWHQGTAHGVAGGVGVGRVEGRGLACSCSSASSSTPRPRIRLPLRPPPVSAAASPVSALVSAAPASASLPRLFMPPPRRLPPAEAGRAVGQACGETAAVASRVLLAKAAPCLPPPPSSSSAAGGSAAAAETAGGTAAVGGTTVGGVVAAATAGGSAASASSLPPPLCLPLPRPCRRRRGRASEGSSLAYTAPHGAACITHALCRGGCACLATLVAPGSVLGGR